MELNDLSFLKTMARGKVRRGGMQLMHTHYQAVMDTVALHTTDTDMLLAAYLHDYIEDHLITDKLLSELVTLRVYSLVKYLTRQDGETSDEHMQRIANSKLPELYLIKYADALHNAEYTEMEAEWHVSYFNEPVAKPIAKYKDRSLMFYRMYQVALVNAAA